MKSPTFVKLYDTSPELQLKYRKKRPRSHLYWSAKARAKIKGQEFSITVADIQIPKICPYLGCKLTHIVGLGMGHRTPTNISLDRIDNSKGYVKGNVRVISELANRMKQNATKKQLLAFAKGIVKLHGRVYNSK